MLLCLGERIRELSPPELFPSDAMVFGRLFNPRITSSSGNRSSHDAGNPERSGPEISRHLFLESLTVLTQPIR